MNPALDVSTPRTSKGATSDSLFRGIRRIPEVLQSMGFSSLRKGQQEPVYQLMAGLDTICVLPTSLGKSLVYALPVLCMDWRAVVFSPLQALMQNQVESMLSKGVRAYQLSGMQSDAENELAMDAWKAGKVQILYVAPERMQNPKFQHIMRLVRPEAVYVDEAHVISQWSVNFRHHYALIGQFIDMFEPYVVGAFTATAPAQVISDVRRVLRMQNAKLWMYMPRRTNLQLSSRAYTGYQQIAELTRDAGGQCLVYCASRAETEQCAVGLQNLLDLNDNVIAYHGDMDKAVKQNNLRMFMSGESRVVVCTNAFGMGIDKPDIRAVIHRHYPGSPEALAQETGRAGRDGKDSMCVTLNDPDSMRIQQFFLDLANPDPKYVRRVYNAFWEESGGGVRPVEMTLDTMSSRAGVPKQFMDPIVEILSGECCIRREPAKSKIAKVKLLKDDFSDAQYRRYAQLIGRISAADAQGYRSADLSYLAAELQVTIETVRRHMKELTLKGSIDYLAPYKGSITHMGLSLDVIDFDYLSKKRIQDSARLQKILDYLSTDDAEKHSWLEGYFEVPPEAVSVPESSAG